ncbi:MAG: MerR family transcriptional regulator [Ignavibacteriae bacterium]|nr:MerR family transcriptional regulator [Ignavibacteriota bacterium]
MENIIKYPIKAVADLTGLTEHVIRIWEKRYKLVIPNRTDTNRRLYSKEDVEKLSLLAKASKSGYSIGAISNYSIDQLKELFGEKITEKKVEELNTNEKTIQQTINNCITFIKSLDKKSFEQELYSAQINFTQPILIEKIITPLIEQIGDMWKSGEIRIMHEHISTTIIRKFLTQIIDSNLVDTNAPKIIIATPKGQHHELGALIVGVVASADGWDVTYIGPDLPGEEIAAAIESIHPKIVALSIVYPSDDIMLDKEMVKISKLLNNGSQVIAGGRSVNSYENILKKMNAKIIVDLNEFRNELENIRK